MEGTLSSADARPPASKKRRHSQSLQRQPSQSFKSPQIKKPIAKNAGSKTTPPDKKGHVAKGSAVATKQMNKKKRKQESSDEDSDDEEEEEDESDDEDEDESEDDDDKDKSDDDDEDESDDEDEGNNKEESDDDDDKDESGDEDEGDKTPENESDDADEGDAEIKGKDKEVEKVAKASAKGNKPIAAAPPTTPASPKPKRAHALGASASSRKRQHTQHAVPLESFVSYVNYRIMDSIGYPGTYRKFMLRRGEQGANWAIEMSNNVHTVQQAVKALAQLEQDIKMSHILRNLHLVWQHVVESNTPPSDLQLTIGVCIITAKNNVPCIVIKGKGRGAQNFTVCSKFATFLYHLWIIYKMDVLIKVYTRKCLDEVDPQGTLSLAEIANAIKDKEHEIKSMSRSLHAAYTHVSRSAVGGLLAVV